MRKSTFNETQIFKILKQQTDGMKVGDICREHGISEATFYSWRKKYTGMDAAMIKELRDLRTENARLKRMFAEAKMDNDILKDVIAKKL